MLYRKLLIQVYTTAQKIGYRDKKYNNNKIQVIEIKR